MIGDAGNSGGGVAVSVVPLLQERFRQLQRMKELREEKQLLRMLSTSSSSCCSTPPTTIAAAHNYELLLLSENYFSGHQLRMFLNPPKPCCQLSLSLWPGEDFRLPRTLKKYLSPISLIHSKTDSKIQGTNAANFGSLDHQEDAVT